MCLLLETIKVQNRTLQNIEKHNARFNKSRNDIFNLNDFIDLRNLISIPHNLKNDVYKCRVIYSRQIEKVEFELYQPKIIRTLKLVKGDHVDYEYKFLDRSQIEQLKGTSDADDILIVKNNLITDASFANVILFDGKYWFTPAQPLLKGTKRQLLLESGIIQEANITMQDLKHFNKIMLINAMLDFDESKAIPIKNIQPT